MTATPSPAEPPESCANYVAPITCLTAPSSVSGRCDWCRGQTAEPPKSTLAAVLADDRGWQVVRQSAARAPSAAVVEALVNYAEHRSAEAHVAATILAATPTAAHVEADGLTQDERRSLGCSCTRLDDQWHHIRFCPVPAVERIVTTHVAELEAALAVAEARLRAVEALHGDRHWCIEPEREQLLLYRPTRDLWPCATLRALATPPQPAPCPACADAMPVHQMSPALQAAHETHQPTP